MMEARSFRTLYLVFLLHHLILVFYPSRVPILCDASGVGQEPTDIRRVIGPVKFAKMETFSSQCRDNEVILIESATIDQGTSSECQGDSCYTDVLGRLDEFCATLTTCRVPVQNLCNGTCASSAELNVTYSCLRVVTLDCRQRCPSNEATRLTATEGYITSEMTREKNCGTADCPWHIQVSPGQNIELALYDFSAGQKRQNQRGSRVQSESSCVVIKERANPKEVQECATGRTRMRPLYTTVSNTVELKLNPNQGKFMLHYRATGCADIVPPYNSRMKRTGNKCEIDCPGSDLKWTLTCEDNKWLGADKLEKCPGKYYAPGSAPISPKTNAESEAGTGSSSSLPMSILIAAVVAITVIIAVLVLTIGFVCLKKHQYETKLGDPLLYGAPTSEFEFCTDFGPMMRPGVPTKAGTATIRSARSGARRSVELLGPGRDNTYAADKQLEMQPLHRPLPMIPSADGQVGSWRPNDQKRIVVQLHHTGSGTMSVIPPYPTMMMRDGRLLPCNCGGTLQAHPSQISVNRPPSHLYFTLDPEVQVEEPATLGRNFPAIEQGGGGVVADEGNHTIPRAHQQHAIASPPPSEMNHQRALMLPPPPPEMLNHTGAMEMVPLNLTIPNHAKRAAAAAANQIPDNAGVAMPLNLTPSHKKSLRQNSNHEAHPNFPPRQNPSVEAHS